MDQTSNGIVPKQGWSWGGAMLNFTFLIGAGRYKYLWWFLLTLIPFVNIVFWIAMFIYLGMNGHSIAAGGTQFVNQSEYDGYVKGTDHAGKILFFIVIILLVIGIVAFLAGFSLLGLAGMHANTMPSTGSYSY